MQSLQRMDGNQAQKKIFNIAAGEDFSRVLALSLLDETQGRSELLTRYKILLPTRRACRVLRDAFLDLSDGRPVLLPQMTPVGDVDEEDLSLLIFGGRGEMLDIPSAMPPLRRQIMLAKIIMKVPDFAQGPDHALALAKALGQLMDKVSVEELDLADLHKIVPHEFSSHWQITLKFLEIISENWPKVLAENNMIDGASRRNILLRALAQHWQDTPPDYPVIAAGTTGSIPATGHLLGVIAQLPQGRIILPGLDMYMDDESWDVLEESHPQYGLKRLLHNINIARSAVTMLGGRGQARIQLASEMMRPAQTTHKWRDYTSTHDLRSMLDGIHYYECKTQQEEAQLIALQIRKTLQEPSATVALISPDRALARRVVALCRRWGIEADDSAGQTLSQSRIGRFMMLCIAVVSKGYSAPSLLAFLKHALCHAGMPNDAYRKMLRDFEKDLIRVHDGVFSYKQIEQNAAEKSEMLGRFAKTIFEALAPLMEMAQDGKRHKFTDFIRAHVAVLECFGAMEDMAGEDVLWRGEDGEEASLFLIDLLQHGTEIGDVTIAEYEKIMEQLAGQKTIRTPYGVHPRLAVLGQLEARLTSADLIIMAGLSEGSWPAVEKHDPWMSRKMRNDFGLPSDEKSIGLAAHDFVQGFCAKNIVMTRAQQVDGTPCVPSRWLQRLDTVLGSAGLSLARLDQTSMLHWARHIDEVQERISYDRPSPCPPLSARPHKVSVTKIENWLRDPYTIYAYYSLYLRKLYPLSKAFDAALKGTILHDIFDRFVAQYPLSIPDNAQDIMIDLAHESLMRQGVADEELNFWLPRFNKITAWFIEHERSWREEAKFFKSEAQGKISLDIDGRQFTIEGRADRIDRRHGGYALIDYKSGGTFTMEGLRQGRYPQLFIEAMMARAGGFEGIDAAETDYIGYWILSASVEDRKKTCAITGQDIDTAMELVEDGLYNLLREFFKAETPFYCMPDMNNQPKFNDYEHLSRLKEWAVLDEAGSEGME